MLAAMAAGMFRDVYGAEASGGGRRSARTDDFARFSPCEFAICKHRTAGVLQLLAPRTNCCLSRNAAGMTYFIGARAIGLEGLGREAGQTPATPFQPGEIHQFAYSVVDFGGLGGEYPS